MNYEVLVLDLDGTLTNSEKKDYRTNKKKRCLTFSKKERSSCLHPAGRPPGILPLAHELELERYGGYVLSFKWRKDHQLQYRRSLIQ